MIGGWPATLTDDWEKVASGGYFAYLVKLRHKPCGVTTGTYYNLSEDSQRVRELIYRDHQCGQE